MQLSQLENVVGADLISPTASRTNNDIEFSGLMMVNCRKTQLASYPAEEDAASQTALSPDNRRFFSGPDSDIVK
jgi:hypothetical protein